MNDTELVDRLRSLAQDPPTIRVDRAAILTSGRRRHVARAAAVTTGVGAVCVAAMVGATALQPGTGPAEVVPGGDLMGGMTASPPSSPAPSLPAGPPRAVVDVENGTIGMPLDPWRISPEDAAVLGTAQDHLRYTCLAEAGVEGAGYAAPRPVVPWIDWTYGYGVWRAEQLEDVARYGYLGEPSRDDEAAYPGSRGRITDSNRAAFEACGQAVVDAGLATGQAEADAQEAGTVEDPGRVEKASEVAARGAAMDEWRACLRVGGVSAPGEDEGLLPGGTDVYAEPLEGQVRIAEIDLACKEQLGTVQKLADIDARLQQEYLDRGGREQAERRFAAQRRQVESARAYLAQHGITVP
ncbi:hypothetical protein [Antribacter gilvus]|uniref:hypothetical protein n=1 Tax=Antribacter gilvus TaxID=2304675 RepID=UPI000F7B600C|nr:hypothetical protein [Antribacter gilvus]